MFVVFYFTSNKILVNIIVNCTNAIHFVWDQIHLLSHLQWLAVKKDSHGKWSIYR